jgi:NAD(P)-dependent dehydrogenase (short-subunit alcohol dehydrogenase family)
MASSFDVPDDWGLKGKVAIVTGAGAARTGIGNGRAAAILLARAGARVIVVDREIELAEQTAAMIKEQGGEGVALQADVTRPEDCAGMVKTALDRFGRLDFLDNNVGIGSRGSVLDETQENWRRVMQVNVETMFLAAKHAIPAMIRGGGGAIVNVSSISALRPRGLTVYTVSKGAVIALTRAMAVDHGKDGIRVNCVAPGPVYTPMVYERGMSPAARDQRRRASVLGIEGTGWNIGHAVRFLLSDYAGYITGQTLVVDGGATLVGPARESQA